MNRKMIRYIVGSLLVIEAALLLLPAVCACFYREWKQLAIFLGVAAVSLGIGLALRLRKPENTRFYATEGYMSVALCWIIMSIMGAAPLLLSGYYDNPVDALFETVSGFTTTGATILTDVEVLPHAVLLWRSLTHWIGGMGVLVFILAILPVSGASSMHLMKAESPGPSVGKLVPKIRSTAAILYALYIVMTIAEICALYIAGASLFEAVNLACSTAGTGGFGMVNSSCGDYSAPIRIIITVFMILFGVNFNVYFLLYSGNIRDAFRCEEVRYYFGIVLFSSLVICLNIRSFYAGTGEAYLQSIFQVGSIITTTGFSTADFNTWPELSKAILVLLMFIGACAGSTGGGMKVSRVIVMVKTIGKELSNITHPRVVRKIHLEGKPIEHEVLRSVNVFVMAYLCIFAASLLLVSLDENSFTTNFTAVAATINNIGPGLEMVGPMGNFAAFSNLSKLVFVFDMLAGRLELFPMLILCTPGMWRKR